MNNVAKIKDGKFLIENDFALKLKQYFTLQEAIDLALKEVKQMALDYLEETGEKSVEANGIKFEYRAGTTRTSLDTKRMKEELPDVYEEYSKTSNVSSTVVVKLC